MTVIKVGSTDVTVPDTLDLGVAVPSEAPPPVDRESAERRLAFLTLFPGARDPWSEQPVPGHDVFVLDTDGSNAFVHVAQWCPETLSFDSDGGWFERVEVELWAYVPGISYQRLKAELARK